MHHNSGASRQTWEEGKRTKEDNGSIARRKVEKYGRKKKCDERVILREPC